MSDDETPQDEKTTDPVEMPRILIDLAQGRLDGTETEAVVSWLGKSAEPEPAPWLVNRAVRIPRQAAGDRPARPAAWRRLVAALVYDNRRPPRLAGARAVGAEQPRLRYQAAGIEIDLEVGESSIAGRLRMLGQVSAAEADLAKAWVAVEGPSGREETDVDEHGQFVLDGLAPGRHRMEIGLAYELIEIPELEI